MADREEHVAEYTALNYPVEVTRDEFGYFARIPDLPGCESSGETLEQAVYCVEEAKEAWIEAALETGRAVPSPRGGDDYSGRFVVRVASSVHRDLVRIAALEGVSLNAFVSSVLSRETGVFTAALRHDTATFCAEASAEPSSAIGGSREPRSKTAPRGVSRSRKR